MTDEVTPVAPVETPVEPSAQVAGALAVFPGAPSAAQIEEWKAKFGEVFCSGFSETELYIFRPISRVEFVKLQVDAAKSEIPITQLEMEEQIVKVCILWASPLATRGMGLKGGTLSTLHEMVMQNSNFVSPQLAAALCIKL